MEPFEAAARFAAFTWYTDTRQAPIRTMQAEASRFSKENWQAFLPVADQGWGRLLLRVAKAPLIPQRYRETPNRPSKRKHAAAGMTRPPKWKGIGLKKCRSGGCQPMAVSFM